MLEGPSTCISFVLCSKTIYELRNRSIFAGFGQSQANKYVIFLKTFLCLFLNLCFAALYSTIEELTAEQTESLVWEHASKLREIFEGKVRYIQINIMQIQMKRN